MAVCISCGKKGFFLKLSKRQFCTECERIELLKQRKTQLEKEIEQLGDTLRDHEERLLLIAKNRELIYDHSRLKEDVERYDRESRQLRLNRDELIEEVEKLTKNKEEIYKELLIKSINETRSMLNEEVDKKKKEVDDFILFLERKHMEANELERDIDLQNNTIQKNILKIKNQQTHLKSMRYSIERELEIENVNALKICSEIIEGAETFLSNTVKLKLNLMDIRELRSLYNQQRKIIRELLIRYQSRYTTKANSSIYQLMVIGLEAELQNVLYNLRYSKLDKAITDIKEITAKYEGISQSGNQSIVTTVRRFIGEIECLYIDCIKIEYEYYVRKERIKEEQRSIKAQMKQEAAERKILIEEQKKIEMEELKYKNEIQNILDQIANNEDQQKSEQLIERIERINEQLSNVENRKVEIAKLQNGQSGYIYIISNLGAFGSGIFKIGMTRRIDPQERVDELGDASVPFRFDVHSFIFSNHAAELEYKLHQHLNNKRVNKVNLRKEFFYTSIDELEELVYSLEPTAIFNRTMMAEQYYKSLSITEIPEKLDYSNDEIEEDLEEQQ